MSRQFVVDRIWATATDPVEVYADRGTEVYRYVGPMGVEVMVDSRSWPHKGTLYRDYWQFVVDTSEPYGPYFDKLLELKSRIIKEYRK